MTNLIETPVRNWWFEQSGLYILGIDRNTFLGLMRYQRENLITNAYADLKITDQEFAALMALSRYWYALLEASFEAGIK